MVKYSTDTLDAAFGALADPTRRAIVAALARGEATVGELAAPFPLSLPAVTKHLNVLEGAGLIVRRKDGRQRRCALQPAKLAAAEAWIAETRRFWEQALDDFAAYLETPRPEDDGHADGRRKKPGR